MIYVYIPHSHCLYFWCCNIFLCKISVYFWKTMRKTDLSCTADWKTVAFHFTLKKVQKDKQLDRDYAYASHFLQNEGGNPVWLFFPLEFFPVYLSSFSISVTFFSGYFVVEGIQDDYMNSIFVFSLKYFHFFALILQRAWEEWEVSFCKIWNLQWILIY